MTDKSAGELLTDLRSPEPSVQADAARELAEREVVAAIPDLVPLLVAPAPAARREAVHALGLLGYEVRDTLGPMLMRMLDDKDDSVRNEVVYALRDLEVRQAIPRLGQMLVDDPHWIVRASSAEVLGDLGDPAAIELLWPGLRDEYDAVRFYVVTALSLLGDATILPRLRQEAAEEPGSEIRAELQLACYRLGDVAMLEPLLALAQQPNPGIAGLLADVIEHLLQETRRPSTLLADAPRIEAALGTLAQRLEAVAANIHTTAETLGAGVSRRVRKPAANGSDASVVAACLAAFPDGDDETRLSAARALAEQAAPELRQRLAEIERDEPMCDVSLELSLACYRLGDPSALGRIITLARHPELEAAYLVPEAITRIIALSPPPPTLTADLSALRTAVREVASRFAAGAAAARAQAAQLRAFIAAGAGRPPSDRAAH